MTLCISKASFPIIIKRYIKVAMGAILAWILGPQNTSLCSHTYVEGWVYRQWQRVRLSTRSNNDLFDGDVFQALHQREG